MYSMCVTVTLHGESVYHVVMGNNVILFETLCAILEQPFHKLIVSVSFIVFLDSVQQVIESSIKQLSPSVL